MPTPLPDWNRPRDFEPFIGFDGLKEWPRLEDSKCRPYSPAFAPR